MEKLEPESRVDLLVEQRLVRFEADVAPGVEIEIASPSGSAGMVAS